jgi:predicted ATPase
MLRSVGLIGRDPELEALAKVVTAHRLVSVTGSPGIGKSALVRAFAHNRPSVLCSLEGATTVDASATAILEALDVACSPSATTADKVGRVGRQLAQRARVLLVLDGADLARTAIDRALAGWLHTAPMLRMVVTSRTRLASGSAHRFDVAALDVPGERERDATSIGRSPAVRLFVHCAALVRPGYALTTDNAPWVAQTVRLLEGIPLAIELSASRLVVLGERELAAHLAERLDILDASTGAARGRSLREAFRFSWDQLPDEDARVLAACSYFRGTFDLHAATAVEGATGRSAEVGMAASLERLEEASLLRAFEPPARPGTRRYALLASLRAFAEQERRRAGHELAIAERHARHYASLSEGRGLTPSTDALAMDRDDMNHALEWALARAEHQLAARILIALAPLVLARGPLERYLERVDRVLQVASLPREQRAELYLARGLARIFHGRRDEAVKDLAWAQRLGRAAKLARVEVLAASKRALVAGLKGDALQSRELVQAARRALGKEPDPRLHGIVLKDHANVLSEEGRNDEAMIELSQARDLFHEAGDLREEGFVLMMLGSRLVDVGQTHEARRDLTAALTALRGAGDLRSEGWTLMLLAIADSEEHDLATARSRLETSLEIFRVIGDAHTEGIVHGYLGNVALEQGAMADAENAYREARRRLAKAGDVGAEAMCIAGAAVADVASGRLTVARASFARAARLVADEGRAARREAIAILASTLEDAKPAKPAKPARVQREARTKRSAGSDTTSEEVRFARRVVERLRTAKARMGGVGGSAIDLVIAHDGSWFRAAGAEEACELGRAGPAGRIVAQLASHRLRYPGRALSFAALVRAGWPDEAMLAAAARNRLHVTIARLRKSGLEGALVRGDEGYLLDPARDVRVADQNEQPRRAR